MTKTLVRAKLSRDAPLAERNPPFPTFADGTEACRTADPELFYPASYGDQYVQPAKQVCRRCPLRWECAEYGIRWEWEHGVLGAMSPQERRDEARRRGWLR